MEPKCFQIQVVVDSNAEARELLRTVVEERLTVSARIVGPITSVVGDGVVQESADKWIIMAMVTRGRVSDLTGRIRELHPDDAAEIVALPNAEFGVRKTGGMAGMRAGSGRVNGADGCHRRCGLRDQILRFGQRDQPKPRQLGMYLLGV